MGKIQKIGTVIIATLAVVIVAVITSNYSASSDVYGSLDQFNVFVSNDMDVNNGKINGRIAVGNELSVSDEATTFANAIDEGSDIPSVVVQGLITLNDKVTIAAGNVIATVINDEQLLNGEGADFSFIRDTADNTSAGFEYFETQAEKVLNSLAKLEVDPNNPNTSQDYEGFYSKNDKSLIVIDLEGQEVIQADSSYSETVNSEVINSEMANTEQLPVDATELVLSKVRIEPLQEAEKIIVRSDVDYVSFNQTRFFYDGVGVDSEIYTPEELKTLAENIVWVFPNAIEVNLDQADVVGSILAPQATITQSGGELAGQVYAANLIQSDGAVIDNVSGFHNNYDFSKKPEESTITVKYEDQDGVAVADPEVYTRTVGMTLTAEVPTIEGYVLDDPKDVAKLEDGVVVTEAKQTITVNYSPRAATSALLTVNHQLSDGTNIIAPVVTQQEIGSSYTTTKMSDVNYKLVTTPTNASGTLSANTVVTYIYTLETTAKTMTIRHVDESGKDLIAAQTVSVEKGTAYDATKYKLGNNRYTYKGLYAGSAAISGTVADSFTVIFEYKANTTCTSSTSGATADTDYSLTGKNQAVNAEMQFNEVKSTGLVEQQPVASAASGYNFGDEYLATSNNPTFMDYRYSLNGNKNYDNFIPIRQTGTFEPINIAVSNDGNGYDLRARTNTSAVSTYASNGIGYQKMIAAGGYQSLNVRFEECQMVTSFNNKSTSTNTMLTTYAYTDYLNLDESLAGVTFDWDFTNKKLIVNIIFEKGGKLYYSGNRFEISLSAYSTFRPNDYSVAYQNTANTKTRLYKPYTSSDRYLYEVIALQSPYVDTSSWYSKNTTLSRAISNNAIYEIYAKNGVVQKSTNRTTLSNIIAYTLPYNPKSYNSIPTSLSSNVSKGISGYIAGATSTVVTGLTLKAEAPVYYSKDAQPSYSLATDANNVSFYENQYTTLSKVPNLSFTNTLLQGGEKTTVGDAYTNIITRISDESGVNFATKGTYSATGFARTRDPETGEFITGQTSIGVTIASATMDYGDAPKTYGEAGAKVGDSSYRYTLGINRNSNRSTHADAEAYPLYSDDARLDDTTGMTDETGWFNMDTNGIGELNVELDNAQISFPYSASGTAKVALWIDYNQNGVFEDFEGTIKTVSSSSISKYGMVTLDIDIDPNFSTLESGDTAFARARIVSGSSMTTADAAKTFSSNYGETEDFRIHFYGKKNKYQICTQVLANSPTVMVKSVTTASRLGPDKNESGIIYTFDVGDPTTAGTYGYYKNATATISSSQGISSNTRAGEPAFFYVTNSQSPNERPANTIHIAIRDAAGNPLNLPLTFSFWDLDDFTSSNVVESVSLDKSSIYTEGLTADMVKRTADTVGIVDDYGSYVKLYTSKQVESEPEAMFLLQGDSLAKADIEIVEEARLLEIGFGFDLGQKDMILKECVEPYEPNAQIQIMDDFYQNEVPIYNSYPFKYQSTNIPFPYFSNLNSITQNLYIPKGVEFVEGDNSVTVYRRDLLGSRTEKDWEVVPKSLYTQKLDMTNNVSSVIFNDPTANGVYGYEYRMEYNFEISEDMKTGQRVVFKSDFVYNKGKASENTEVYQLNDVTAVVKEAFTADINTIMSDETIHVETDSTAINYTYEYLNCDTCTNQTDPVPLSGDIVIPIPEEEKMDFYTTSNFDRYEDIQFTLYDNDMKVFEFAVRRWYPSAIDRNIEDTIEATQISEDLNPVGQTIQIRAAYKRYPGFDKPIKTTYAQEVINVKQDTKINDADNAILRLDDIDAYISTEPQNSVPKSWQPSYWGPIEVDDLTPVFDSELVYLPVEEELCTGEDEEGNETETECIPPGYHVINIEAGALDSTLETSKVTIDDKDYKTILFRDKYAIDEEGRVTLDSVLDNRYVIESYSGRIYNKRLNSECKLTTEAKEDYTGLYCYDDVKNNYHLATSDIDQILAGYNDALDSDKRVNSVVTNGMPLSTELEKGDRFKYYVYLADFGLNNTSVTIADTLEVKSTPIGYYKNDSSYYFKRTAPSDSEVECIKDKTCTDNYQVLASGTVDNPNEIKQQISNDTSLLDSFKSNVSWLTDYYKATI